MSFSLADNVPDDIESLKAALVAARTQAATVATELSNAQALIAHLNLMIAKLKREKFGVRSERTARLVDQLELQLEELETTATEDELAAESAASKTTNVAAQAAFTQAFPRTSAQRTDRHSWPDLLPLLRQ